MINTRRNYVTNVVYPVHVSSKKYNFLAKAYVGTVYFINSLFKILSILILKKNNRFSIVKTSVLQYTN